MRIKRFTATDMRAALRMVREEQGADAVIVSSRQTPEGVEVVAATDYDEALVQQTLRTASGPVDAAVVRAREEERVQKQDSPPSRDAVRSEGRAVYLVDGEPSVPGVRGGWQQPALGSSQDLPGTVVEASNMAPASQEQPSSRLEQMMAAFRPVTNTHAAPHQGHVQAHDDGAATRRLPKKIDVRIDEDVVIPSFAEALAKFSPPDLAVESASVASPLLGDTPAPFSNLSTAMAVEPGELDELPAANDPVCAATRQAPATAAPAEPSETSETSRPALRLLETDPAVATLRAELSAMRQVIERELGSLAVERLRGSPARASAMDALAAAGFDQALAQKIAQHIDPALPASAVNVALHEALAHQLPVLHEEPIEDGGVIALLGPTGAGKTTTIAKLAARFAGRHRARDVALVTTDTERAGAREQLHALGRRMGITVCDADGPDGLSRALEQLADYPLVMVDTAGHGLRDRALLRQILWVRAAERLRSLLVVPANVHPNDLNELLRRYRPAAPQGVVLTKLDESVSPGAALSAIVQHGLPLAYTTAGQCTRDDIEFANARHLAERLVAQPAAQDTPALDNKDEGSRHALA